MYVCMHTYTHARARTCVCLCKCRGPHAQECDAGQVTQSHTCVLWTAIYVSRISAGLHLHLCIRSSNCFLVVFRAAGDELAPGVNVLCSIRDFVLVMATCVVSADAARPGSFGPNFGHVTTAAKLFIYIQQIAHILYGWLEYCWNLLPQSIQHLIESCWPVPARWTAGLRRALSARRAPGQRSSTPSYTAL